MNPTLANPTGTWDCPHKDVAQREAWKPKIEKDGLNGL